VASASMLSNDQLAQGPNGSWKNLTTIKPAGHEVWLSTDYSFYAYIPQFQSMIQT